MRREAQVVMDLMFPRPARRRPFLRRKNIREQPATRVARVAGAPGDARQPHFQRGAQAVRENHTSVEFARADQLCDAENFRSRKCDHLIHLRDETPHVREFFRCHHGDVRGGIAVLQRTHGGHAHHGVAEPVGRADDDALHHFFVFQCIVRNGCSSIRLPAMPPSRSL